MSNQFLYHLNGNNNGIFKAFLDQLTNEANICWYPSSGQDFRDLLYVNQNFSQRHPAMEEESIFPDLYLHTDYYPWQSDPIGNDVIYSDDRTTMTIVEREQLPNCHVPLDPEIVDFVDSQLLEKVFFMKVRVNSKKQGEFYAYLLYVFVENESFCAKKLLPFNAKISHVIYKSYGGGEGGGGKVWGDWLLNVLSKLKCHIFITNQYDLHDGVPKLYLPGRQVSAVYKLYPELSGNAGIEQLSYMTLDKRLLWTKVV
jgi:hypothetical protein